ncbi:MAG: hypothetical protein H0W09_02545 [Solirubrobacterales bacterium]|nr:hypothetical protein [Solirubrobacterales bacterium]
MRRARDEALELLEALAGDDEVALVLAAHELAGTTGGDSFETVRQLHSHAKRGLLVPAGAWANPATAAAILDARALGRID